MSRLKLWSLLAGLFTASALVSLLAGPQGVSISGLLDVLAGRDSLDADILVQLRLPRLMLGALVGAGLGMSGAMLQGYFRNPLADPGVIGVSACGGLGAVLALYFGVTGVVAMALPVAAVLGSAIGVALVLLLAGRSARATTLVLAGVAVSATASALTALVMNLAPNPWALAEIAYWLMGSLIDASWHEVLFASPFILAGLVLAASTRRTLDALSLGEEEARSLGQNGAYARYAIVGATALMVGAGVAVAGSIGFVGLVTPHVLRPLVGHQPSRLLWPSALGGAILVMSADLAVRFLSGPGMPLYLGVLTALLGAPFFLWLVRKTREDLA